MNAPPPSPHRCRIALTGGPGGGKTTAVDLFRREMGEAVVIVPEAATMMFTGGFPRYPEVDAVRSAQLAIYHVQQEMTRIPRDQLRWNYPLDDQASVRRRQRGQQLFALALSFVLKPALRPRLLDEGRKLGMEYGHEAHASKVSLVEAGRAVRFFRNQLIQAVRAEESLDLLDAVDLRIQQQIDLFLDEVLYAVLSGYDEQSINAKIVIFFMSKKFKMFTVYIS